MQTITANLMSCDEFDKLVNQHIANGKYEFVSDQEVGRGIFKFEVDENEKIDNYALEKINSGNYMYIAHWLLVALMQMNVIQPGIYLIEVDW